MRRREKSATMEVGGPRLGALSRGSADHSIPAVTNAPSLGEESLEEVEAIRKMQGRAKIQGRTKIQGRAKIQGGVTKAKRAAASEDSAE